MTEKEKQTKKFILAALKAQGKLTVKYRLLYEVTEDDRKRLDDKCRELEAKLAEIEGELRCD